MKKGISKPAVLKQKASTVLKKDVKLPESDVFKLIHELEVHQIELEMQNEELLLAKSSAREAAEKYTELYDFAPSGYLTLSREGKIFDLNLTAANMLGKERSRLANKQFGFFVSNDTIPVFNHFLETVLKSNTKKSCEVVLVTKDELHMHVFITGIAARDKEQCIITVIDITRQKQAEEALVNSEIRYRRLFESAKDGMLILNAGTGKIVDANPFIIELVGYSKEQLKEKEVWDLGFFRDIAANKEKFYELQQKKIIRYEDLPLETADGRKINVEFVSNVYVEDKKKVIQCNIRDITNRKRDKELLIATEMRYRRLFESAKDGILILDAETGMITDVNPYLLNMLGFTKEQLLNKEIWEIGFFKDIAANKEKFSGLQKKRYVRYDNLLCTTIDGRSIHIEFVSNVYHEDKKKVIQCNIRDISTRVEAEELLVTSEARYRRLFESAKDGILILDASSGKITDVNPFLVDMLKYSPEDFIDKPLWEIGLFKDIAANKEKFFELQKKKYVRYDDLPLETADGRKINVEFVSNVYAVDHQQVIQCNIREITQRILAESILREKEVQYRNLANSGTALIWTSGPDRVANYFNEPWLKFTGRTLEQELGKGWKQGVHPDDLETSLNIYISAYNKREAFEVEYRLRHVSGEYRWIKDMGSPNIDSHGQFSGYIMNCFDITQHKQAEQEMTEAKERAEESDRLKSAFLANMSHEIRTPMNGILGFTDLLKEKNLTGEQQQKYIRIIEESGTRMLNILNDIVSISKVESGQMEVSISKTNINKQIEYIYTFFKPAVEQKGIDFFYNISLPEEQATIKTDREKVYAILTNLVKNAIKFTEQGSIEFGYKKKANYLEFYVKDTGTGIREDQQKIVFERFRQVSESLTRNFEGAGLGLSISKAYVEILGGKIWLKSEIGKGSAFYFTIPYSVEPEETTVRADNFTLNTEDNTIQGLKILIAEDNKLSEMLISIAVQIYSQEIISVKNGIEAVVACHNNPDIDLVLMDIHMPELDGYEATRQIRRFNKDVIIIAQTANALTGEKEKVIAAGCNDYISKPFNQTILRELIRKYFKQKV